MARLAWFDCGVTIDNSQVILTRTSAGVAASNHAHEINRDEVITVWWAIWERPERYSLNLCSMDDIFQTNEAEQFVFTVKNYFILNQASIECISISMLYATGNIVDHVETVDFNAFLPLGDQTGQTSFAYGLLNSYSPEIHLILRTHSSSTIRLVFMSSSIPNGWLPAIHSACVDLQAVVFAPIDSSVHIRLDT